MAEVALEFWLEQERRIIKELAALQAAGLAEKDMPYFDLILNQLGQAQDAIHNITGEKSLGAMSAAINQLAING